MLSFTIANKMCTFSKNSYLVMNLQKELSSLDRRTRSLCMGAPLPTMCSFPRAAVTKYHKLGGLKQQKIILSQFWRPESKIKVSTGPRSLWDAGENPALLCPLLTVATNTWSPLFASLQSLSHGVLSCVSLSLLGNSSSYKDTRHWI